MSARARLIAALSFACFAVVLGGPSVAGAATPGEVTTYPVKPCSNLLPAPEGVLVRSCDAPALVDILPGGGVISRSVPAEPANLIATGPSGELWLGRVKEGVYGPEPQAVDRVAADGSVRTFDVPVAPGYEGAFFHGLVVGGDGTAWAAIGYEKNEGFSPGSTVGGELLRISSDGQTKSFTLPHDLYPEGLVLGPEGSVWFTAVIGRRVGEHSYDPGTGFVGRLDPSGKLASFRTPIRGGVPSGPIAIGPDGKLWFAESGDAAIDTIAPDGAFGRRHPFRLGSPEGSLAFGPEGDLWTPVFGGIARMTPWGQQTLFPGGRSYGEESGVVAGSDGGIWSLGHEDVERLVPGAPGIDVRRLTGRMDSGTIGVLLACGGSASACEGTLEIELRTPSAYRRSHKGDPDARTYSLASVPYSVPAESQALFHIPVSTKALALIALFRHFEIREGVPLEVRATVAGGPPLRRVLRATLGTRPAATKVH